MSQTENVQTGERTVANMYYELLAVKNKELITELNEALVKIEHAKAAVRNYFDNLLLNYDDISERDDLVLFARTTGLFTESEILQMFDKEIDAMIEIEIVYTIEVPVSLRKSIVEQGDLDEVYPDEDDIIQTIQNHLYDFSDVTVTDIREA
jgi:hypothetical protein